MQERPHANKKEQTSTPFTGKRLSTVFPVNEAEARYQVIRLAQTHPGALTNLLFALQNSGANWITILEKLQQAITDAMLDGEQRSAYLVTSHDGRMSHDGRTRDELTEEEFTAAAERLIAEFRAKGLSDEALLTVIEDIESILRERMDNRPRSG